MKVIKRNGSKEEFDKTKIYQAILKAMKYGSGIVKPKIAEDIASTIEQIYTDNTLEEVSIADIELRVFDMLITRKQKLTAKAYEAYRSIREFQRNHTDLDKEIEGVVGGSNKDTLEENSNKNGTIASTQRDLIAGEYSKDYSRRCLLPANILHAHDEGIIHMHDLDYFIQFIPNCCLINLEDMLQNGTIINRKRIDPPKSFQTACTVTTQIIQQICNGQYGGQTFTLTHLAPFVRISYNKWKEKAYDDLRSIILDSTTLEQKADEIARKRLKEEIDAGMQTIQYQLNTFNTSNGQSPFLSIFMYINEDPEYEEETAMLIEAMLNQRIIGIKNEVGEYISPAFPKLLYVTDENNIHEDSKYFYLTKLAAKCWIKRMMPDFISAKIMRSEYDGEVFPPMGCRSFLGSWKDPETDKYKWYGRFNAGVVTINLVDAGLSAKGNLEDFWKILDERLELCKQALLLRHERLKNTSVDISPIHWKHGGIARLKSENFNKLLYGGYSTISLGYAGVYECVMALIGESNTTPNGEKLALEIVQHLKNACDKWKKEYNIGFALYGTPLEATTYKFARNLQRRFGIIKDITDHEYVTNSYHVNVREKISAKEKLLYEAKFQTISSGGAISYVEVANMKDNPECIIQLIQFMYENIRYAEMNTKLDFCQKCGFEGEILLDDNNEWYCPQCGNRDKNTMNCIRRTCGYLGENFWNEGRTEEIHDRYVHVDNKYEGED